MSAAGWSGQVSGAQGRWWGRAVALLTALAVMITVAQVNAPVAHADTAGTPPNIIDYNRVIPADWPALQRFERKAAQETLENHSLPAEDYDAVRGWGRNQVRTQMWADLVVILKKEDSARTDDEKAVYRWFQGLVQTQNVKAARASVDEFIKYSGLTEDTYTNTEPVNYNDADKSLATGGYCVYRAPGPYADDYTGYLDQSCYTSPTATTLLSFAIPMPSYDEFIAYGQYQANKLKYADPGFANISFDVAASLSVGASLALVGAALPIGAAIGAGITLSATGAATAAATAVFPFAARAGSLALVAAGAVATVVATAILFIVTVVLASIQIDAQLKMGQRLKDNLTKLTNNAPDVHGYVLADEERAKDSSLSDDERKPKYYPGFFTTFLDGTRPEATEEPCDSGIVVGGGIYAPGCVNAPAVAPVAIDDPVFSVLPQGASTPQQQRSVGLNDPYNGATMVTRPSGKGWFVHTSGGTGKTTQSLAMYFEGWDGGSYYTERVWDATNGYRFATTPVGDGAEAKDAVVSKTINAVKADGTKVTLGIVASSVSSLDVTVPESVDLNVPAEFSASSTGTGAVSYTWWFPRLLTEGFGVVFPVGVPSNYLPFTGATVTRAFADAGAVPVYLEAATPDGTKTLRQFVVNVIDPRAVDVISFTPPAEARVGQQYLLDVTSLSGSAINLRIGSDDVFVTPSGVCGQPDFYTTPLRVSALKAGTCTVVVTSVGNAQYQPAKLELSFPVLKSSQAITAAPLADLRAGKTQQVSATATSKLPVTASVPPELATTCAASGTTITAKAAGTCLVVVSQAGSTDYLPAPPVWLAFEVLPPVTVTARDETVVYGETPSYGFDVSGTDLPVTGVVCSAEPPLTKGTHPVTCSGGDAGEGIDIEYVPGTLTVTAAPATVTVTPPQVQYSDAVPDLVAAWSPSGLIGSDGLAGTLSGCTASGLAGGAGAVTSPAGSYPLTGCGGLSNPNYDVTYTGALTVAPEDATVAFDGDWYFSTGTSTTATATLRATVGQAADGSPGDLTRARVDFLVFKADNNGSTPDASATDVAVDATGNASASVPGLTDGIYRVVVRVSPGNEYFSATSTSDDITVYQPVPGAAVTGAGWVSDAASGDRKGHFGISVRYDKKKQPQGKVTFSWRDPGNGYDYLVRSNSWSGGTLVIGKGTAGVLAKASLTVVDPRTGLVVTSLSGGNYGIKVDVADNGKGGSTDTYAVTVRTPAGAVLHSVGSRTLGGGNISVQQQ